VPRTDTTGELTALPDPLAVLRGPTSKGREIEGNERGRGGRRKGRGRGKKGRGEEARKVKTRSFNSCLRP